MHHRSGGRSHESKVSASIPAAITIASIPVGQAAKGDTLFTRFSFDFDNAPVL